MGQLLSTYVAEEAWLPTISLASLQLKKLNLGCCMLQTYDIAGTGGMTNEPQEGKGSHVGTQHHTTS